MDANLAAGAASLSETAIRLQRVGLIIDRTAFSPAHRRAAFALQCLAANYHDKDEPKRTPIGFAYSNEQSPAIGQRNVHG